MSLPFTPPILAAYWLPSVGIGAAVPPPPVLNGKQTVVVPVTDLLNYMMPDGQPQVNIINLMGATFLEPADFGNPNYLKFDPELQQVLNNGSVQQLQKAGIKVVLTILGSDYTSVGWSSVPANQLQGFVNYLNDDILVNGYGLDGIDIDDEYSIVGNTLTETVAAMYNTFPAGTIISKALFDDENQIAAIAGYLTYGGIMTYGDDAGNLESIFENYVTLGMPNNKLVIGVNAGPVGHGSSFTSVGTTTALAQWQPATGGNKLGMMVWSFSQDIQQFTAYPQNQVSLAYPNTNDHEWQSTILAAYSSAANK